jgi:hypothetical protein
MQLLFLAALLPWLVLSALSAMLATLARMLGLLTGFLLATLLAAFFRIVLLLLVGHVRLL